MYIYIYIFFFTELMDSYNRGPQAPQNRGARSPPPPPSPQGGGFGVGGNQSWLTGPLSVWSYDTCQVKKVNPLRQGQGAPSGATLEWRLKVAPWREWRLFILDI